MPKPTLKSEALRRLVIPKLNTEHSDWGCVDWNVASEDLPKITFEKDQKSRKLDASYSFSLALQGALIQELF